MIAVSSQKVTEQMRGKGVQFYRIRRITGYLTDDVKSWNTPKQAEERDRLSHAIQTIFQGGN